MGAPIYLVSACTTGEEFVAAFRRYADKQGLFIPIGEPLPPGGRTRFAVTLRDGGVMIEGEAEVVSSARVPSVVHGRVGMTLRFLEPDEASKTTLGELERARLAMKPPPPSVPPRPAQIPDGPRPVPPPVQGRIDAVNALAECVAIGDTSGLGPPLPAAAAPPPKTGPRFVMPPLSAGGHAAPGTSPSGGLGMARTSAAPRAATAPLPVTMTRPGERAEPGREVAPPQITPRATPQPDRLRQAERAASPEPATDPEAPPTGFSQTMTAVRPVQAGPTSDTMIAEVPPTPALPPIGSSSTAPRHAVAMSAVARPATQPEGGPISTTMTAVPALGTIPPSSPTEIGGVLIESLPPLPPMGMSSPEIALPPPESSPEIIVPVAAEDDASARTQIHAGAPPPPAPAPAPPPAPAATAAPSHGAATVRIDVPQTLPGPVDLLGRTLPGPAPLDARVTTPITVQGLSLPPRAPAPPMLDDVEIAEPTDISMPPEPPALAAALPTEAMAALEPDAEAPSPELPAEPEPEVHAGPEAEVAPQRSRRTVIGVAVTPAGVMVPPATPTVPIAPIQRDAPIAASIAAADEATGLDGVIVDDSTVDDSTVDDSAVDVSSPTAPVAPRVAAPVSPAPPAPDTAPPDAPPPAPPPAVASGLPSGDWTIARDPDAPDGWSDPFVAPPAPAGSAPAAPAPVPPLPVSAPPAAPVALAAVPPADAAPLRPSPRPNEVPIVEPKVQIDPTLIEPRQGAMPVPVEPAAAISSPALPMYDDVASRPAIEAPAIQMMMAVPQPGPFAPPHASQVPGYPLDPSFPVMPVAMPSPSSPQLVGPGASGFGDPRYASDPALPAQTRRRRLIIVLASAVVAVLIGIAALLIVRSRHPATAAPTPDKVSDTVDKPADPRAAPSGAQAPVQAADPAPSPAAPGAPSAPAPSPERAAAAGTAAAAPPPPGPGECFADVSSQPAGADILLGQTVIGTTPQRVTLPCGSPVALLIRKPHMASAARTITPTPGGVPVKVTLLKQTFLIRVSSTPAGATVTLNGKSLGVTPTTVKVPAFESSALSITKDGYATEIETVAPKANGGKVHTLLKRLERRRPR